MLRRYLVWLDEKSKKKASDPEDLFPISELDKEKEETIEAAKEQLNELCTLAGVPEDGPQGPDLWRVATVLSERIARQDAEGLDVLSAVIDARKELFDTFVSRGIASNPEEAILYDNLVKEAERYALSRFTLKLTKKDYSVKLSAANGKQYVDSVLELHIPIDEAAKMYEGYIKKKKLKYDHFFYVNGDLVKQVNSVESNYASVIVSKNRATDSVVLGKGIWHDHRGTVPTDPKLCVVTLDISKRPDMLCDFFRMYDRKLYIEVKRLRNSQRLADHPEDVRKNKFGIDDRLHIRLKR